MWRLWLTRVRIAGQGGRAAGKECGPMGAPRAIRPTSWLVRRRWLRAAPLAALAVAVSLLVPSAGRAVPGGRATLISSSAALAGNPAEELAKLEAQAAKLSRQYRGDLV